MPIRHRVISTISAGDVTPARRSASGEVRPPKAVATGSSASSSAVQRQSAVPGLRWRRQKANRTAITQAVRNSDRRPW